MLISEEKLTTGEEDAHLHVWIRTQTLTKGHSLTLHTPQLAPPSYDQALSPSPPIAGPSTSIATYPTSTEVGSQSRWHYQSQSETILSHLLHTFVTAATNYVYISDLNNSVKGSWTIDTDLSPPPAFLAPLEQSERKNLYVHARSGSLNAKIRLISLPKAVYERATFHCSSQNGSVRVYIVSYRLHSPSCYTY